MSREDLHFRLRIPEELKEKVRKAAEDAGRSMTAEIVRRLDQSFEHDYEEIDGAITDLYKEVERLKKDLRTVIEVTGLDGQV